MKSRIVLAIFALPFFGVGVWMLFSISSMAYDAWQMQSWHPVSAALHQAGYATHRGDDSTTYKAYASYSYVIRGERFTGERVSLGTGGDNIGDYQQDMGNRLQAAFASGTPISVFVNPDNPADSIIDRKLRWPMVGFHSLFLLVFGGMGLSMLVFALRTPRARDATLAEFKDKPWLLNPDWQSATLRSNSRLAMWAIWGFAAFWSLISAPLPFVAYDEVVNKQNHLALVALLFPLIGLGLVAWAIKQTREWLRFGTTPLTLDPFPGSIGGHVGGTIDMRLPYDSATQFVLTLSSIHSYASGSGKSRRRKESTLWQDQLVAHTEPGPNGMRLVFRFDVPEGLKISDAQPEGDSNYLWRLHLAADLPGANLDRDFEVPVYATSQSSIDISDRQRGAADGIIDKIFENLVRKRVQISNDGLGKTLLYPMGQALFSNFAGILVGGSFAAAGYYITMHEGRPVFGGVFGGTGALVAIAALYMVFKSLEVTRVGDTITSVRRWLGIPLGKKTLRRPDFVRFEKGSNMQTQTGRQTIRHYRISAIDKTGNSVVLGENFHGELEARAAIRMLESELGLHEQKQQDIHAPHTTRHETRFSLNKEMFDRKPAAGNN
ncbi:MAG TPA: DUF3592 domain-containing protein [Woeseiaceae bacterium]|nr:DUF3592 domain-containing protein [Woeseiaceae bacterium]